MFCTKNVQPHRIRTQIDGLIQKRRNSSALAMELRLSCTNPVRWCCQKYTPQTPPSHRRVRYSFYCEFKRPDLWSSCADVGVVLYVISVILDHVIRRPNCTHDEVMKWKHFLYYWPFVRGIHQWLVDFLRKGPVMQSFAVSFDLSLHILLNEQLRGSWIKMFLWSFDVAAMKSFPKAILTSHLIHC